MFRVCRLFLNLSIFFEDIIDMVQKPRWPTSNSMQAFLPAVPHMYQVNGKTVPPGESQAMNDKDWGTYEAANPKQCGRA